MYDPHVHAHAPRTALQALTQRKFEWNAEVLACTSQLMRLRHALEFPGGDPDAAEGDGGLDGGCVCFSVCLCDRLLFF